MVYICLLFVCTFARTKTDPLSSNSIWIIYLTNAVRQSILYNLVPFVTSDFQFHSLLTAIDVVASAMSAATYIPMAKLLDVWGRAEGFILMDGLSTLGLILMAVSKNLATFCAAQVKLSIRIIFYEDLCLTFDQVFYSAGTAGAAYAVEVITVDSTNLRNRGLAFAFICSPYTITAFAGPAAADSFYTNVNWQWGFGAFAIIIPIVSFPLYAIIALALRKAKRNGMASKERSGRITLQTVWHVIAEFDSKWMDRIPIKSMIN